MCAKKLKDIIVSPDEFLKTPEHPTGYLCILCGRHLLIEDEIRGDMPDIAHNNIVLCANYIADHIHEETKYLQQTVETLTEYRSKDNEHWNRLVRDYKSLSERQDKLIAIYSKFITSLNEENIPKINDKLTQLQFDIHLSEN